MFYPIGTWGDARCVYTRGATDVARAMTQLSELRHSRWIWFFDCAGLKTLDMQVVTRIANIIREEHSNSLQRVWILNCTTWMRGILRLFGQEKVHTLDGRLETAITLQAVGCPHDVLESVTASMSASPDTKPVRR